MGKLGTNGIDLSQATHRQMTKMFHSELLDFLDLKEN